MAKNVDSTRKRVLEGKPMEFLLAEVEGEITSIKRVVEAINDLLVIEDAASLYRRSKSAMELSWYLIDLTARAESSAEAAVGKYEKEKSQGFQAQPERKCA